MAAAAHLRQNIAIVLLVLGGEIEALPERAREQDEGAWRDGEWMTNMARLEWLIELEAQGQLLPPERAAYTRVLRRLRSCLPLTRQLDLPVPEKVLEAVRVAA